MHKVDKALSGLQKIIKIAEQEARVAFSENEVPVGAVVFTDTYEIISKAHNLVEHKQDVVAHAEMLAIQDAQRQMGQKYLNNLQIFITLEPCAMCASAISYARFKRLFFGVQDSKFGAILNGVRIFEKQTALYEPEIYPDIGSPQSQRLLRDFFKLRR